MRTRAPQQTSVRSDSTSLNHLIGSLALILEAVTAPLRREEQTKLLPDDLLSVLPQSQRRSVEALIEQNVSWGKVIVAAMTVPDSGSIMDQEIVGIYTKAAAVLPTLPNISDAGACLCSWSVFACACMAYM